MRNDCTGNSGRSRIFECSRNREWNFRKAIKKISIGKRNSPPCSDADRITLVGAAEVLLEMRNIHPLFVLFILDGVTFDANKNVNKHNCIIWSTENLHVIKRTESIHSENNRMVWHI